MIKIRQDKTKTLNEAVEQDVNKVINERAETNIKKIDNIELNEFLAGLHEIIEYEINPDLEYWRIILGVEDGKAYIDLESKDVDDWNLDGWSVEDLLSIDNPVNHDEFVINIDKFDELKKAILREKSQIITKVIPEIAREWGFRNIKESVEDFEIEEDKSAPELVSDALDRALFSEAEEEPDENFFETPVKVFNIDGKIEDRNCYAISQFDIKEGDWGNDCIYYISLIDREDSAPAEAIANKFGFETHFAKIDECRPKDNYNYIFAISVPVKILDMTVEDYFKNNK